MVGYITKGGKQVLFARRMDGVGVDHRHGHGHFIGEQAGSGDGAVVQLVSHLQGFGNDGF